MDRNEFSLLLSDFPTKHIEMINAAYWLAKDVHRGQERDGGERYFEHVREVALILIRMGVTNPYTIIKALLHDLIEDTTTPFFVVRSLFGDEMLNSLLILSKKVPIFDEKTGVVTEWKKIHDDVYYGRLMASNISNRLVKCADRLHNLDSMSVWDRADQVAYAMHTQQYVIPLARLASMELMRRIDAKIKSVL